MEEVYDVLTELESHAARRAAQAGYKDVDLQALSQSIDNMDKALEQGDLEGWAQSDDQFHSELVRLGGNSRIVAIAGAMADQVRRARLITLHLRPTPRQSNKDHRAVLQAIRDRDADRAHDLHRSHRQAAKVMLVDLLKKHRLHAV